MSERAFSELPYIDEEIQKAVLNATGGREPDDFIVSPFGAAVKGPPDPQTALEEQGLIDGLNEQLKAVSGRDDITDKDGQLRYDAPDN